MGGCGDPKCPEGMSIKLALESALASGDLDAYFSARELQSVKASRLWKREGWGKLTVVGRAGKIAFVKVKLTRKDFVEQVKAVDKTVVPSFDGFDELNKYVSNLYGESVYYHLYHYPKSDREPHERMSVGQISVDADIQNLGISNHLKSILVRYADEHDVIISGTPTNKGDGTLEEGDEGWRENALAHRARLVRSYKKFGYVENVCFEWSQPDYLTGEKQMLDEAEVNKFTLEARGALRDAGMWVRWPNGVIPPHLLAKPKRQRKVVSG